NPQYSLWTQKSASGAFEALPGGGANQDGARGLAWTPQGQVASLHWVDGRNQIWLEGGTAPNQPITLSNLLPILDNLSVAPNGDLVFRDASPGTGLGFQLFRAPEQGGAALEIPLPNASVTSPAVVEGGAAAALIRTYIAGKVHHQQVWVVPFAGGAAHQVSPAEVFVNFLLAMPDQKHVLAIEATGPHQSKDIAFALDGSRDIEVHPREDHGRFGGPYGLTP